MNRSIPSLEQLRGQDARAVIRARRQPPRGNRRTAAA